MLQKLTALPGLVMLALFPALATAESIDDLKALFAPEINMDELGWLNGIWGVVEPDSEAFATCESADGEAYISFDLTDPYRPIISAQAEPAYPDNERETGFSPIAEDDTDIGFLNVSPRGWEDAYLKFRPKGEDHSVMEVRMWEFSGDDTAWFETTQFYLEKCES